MPWASAPKAPCVEVWLSPQTMVMPGSVKPCSGPMMWTMPWRWSSSLKYSTPKSRGVLGQRLDLQRRFRIVDAVGAVGGRHVVVDDGERLLRRAHLAAGHAQALEGLRARHLVDEVAVDIEEAGAVRRLVHDVVVPDLVVEGAGLGHGPSSELGFLARQIAIGGRIQILEEIMRHALVAKPVPRRRMKRDVGGTGARRGHDAEARRRALLGAFALLGGLGLAACRRHGSSRARPRASSSSAGTSSAVVSAISSTAFAIQSSFSMGR